MAQGKQIGEWACKFTSWTITPGPAGSIVQQGNYEGPTTGEGGAGTVIGTIAVWGGNSGTYSMCVVGYLDDGNALTGSGEGTYESTGKHHWATQGLAQLSDGSNIILSGELDLAERSWTGKMFENS